MNENWGQVTAVIFAAGRTVQSAQACLTLVARLYRLKNWIPLAAAELL